MYRERLSHKDDIIDSLNKKLGLLPAATVSSGGQVENEGIINDLRKQLEQERTKPELHGTINQFYLEPHDGLVVIELSLWNKKKTSTSVREFSVKVFAGENRYEGITLPVDPYFFIPMGRSDEDAIPLSPAELPRRPVQGYSQGQSENGWLCFVITTPMPDKVEVTKITLVALDVFDTFHEVTAEPPPRLYGRITTVR